MVGSSTSFFFSLMNGRSVSEPDMEGYLGCGYVEAVNVVFVYQD